MASTADLVTNSVADLTEKNEEKKEKTFKQLTVKEKLIYVKNFITVEPIIGLYVMVSILCSPAIQVLEFDKACQADLGQNTTVCDAIGENVNLSTAAQQVIGTMHSWQTPLQTVMPLIVILFLGSYSDRHKWRKPFLLIPLVGELFAVVSCIMCVVFMREWPLMYLGISQTVVPSLFGGQPMIVMATFAYIADVSDLETRTLRIGVVQIIMNLVTPVTQLFAASLLLKIGYIAIFSIGGCLYLIALLYGIFCLKEPRVPQKISKKNMFLDMFNPKHAIDTFNVLLKKSPGNKRLYIALILVIMFIYSGVQVGEFSVFYFYVITVFQWNIEQFYYLLSFNTWIHLAGTLLAIPLFTKILKLSDFTIILVTFIDKIISNIIFGFAKTGTMLYVASTVSLITGVTAVGIRSLATKVVSENNLGKAQSLFGIVEALSGAVLTPIYNNAVYLPSADSFPSLFFFFSCILYGIGCILVILMFLNDKKKGAQTAPQGEENIGMDHGVSNGTENGKSIPMEDIQITHM